ncbi:hypothetical protein MTO96_046634 [Rhipicephalus appendiculatus]
MRSDQDGQDRCELCELSVLSQRRLLSVSSFRLPACPQSPRSNDRRPTGRTRRRRVRSSHASSLRPEPTVSAPPRAKVQRRSVATWTHQDRQEAPTFFVSDLPWKAQRRVRREMPLDRVPWPFRGRTITEADVLSQGARLPDPLGVRECALCGVNVYSKSHYKGSLHVAKAKVAARDGGRPTSSAPPAAVLPDKDLAAMCRERLQENPNFAALVGPVFQAATIDRKC